ncbi:hypothetical protein HPB48_021279 [Haemaphysalis longicornis]|uniref:Uncharacterized protein n=1 Tax=Haemaphysalis longicornis TaxID=44386 RepID=A0A9J6FX39_HAELO|nr:hypothetical protein HPB48_021279 [Haemaphysalis longicornis]
MTLADLKEYKVDVKPALRRELHNNLSLLSVGPPAGGIVAEFLLAVMDTYRDPSQPFSNSLADDDTTVHRFLETIKFAFPRRMELGDPTTSTSLQ